MNKTNITISVVIAIIVVIMGLGIFKFNWTNSEDTALEQSALDVKNISYVVGEVRFDLKDGKAENEVEGGFSKNVLMMFGEPVYGDLNEDGKMDAAVMLVNNAGGSGIFYYAALVVSNGDVYVPTNAMLLGDRIAPQTVEIRDGRAIYNIADRRADEPMSTPPSISESVWINFDKNTWEIGEWIKDFEGESAVSLTEAEARSIAEKSCIKGKESLEKGIKNKGTQTWWFDANLNSTQNGCNPACVVNEKTKTAEINWRCTGLLLPE